MSRWPGHWAVSRPVLSAHLTLGNGTCGTHLIGSGVGTQSGVRGVSVLDTGLRLPGEVHCVQANLNFK